MHCRNRPAGFSLIELLIAIALMGVLAGLALPDVRGNLHEQLHATAQLVSMDLAYGRSLAVTYGSTYRLTFDRTANRYVITHTGANATLNTLPPSPFRSPRDPANQHIVDLDELPRIGPSVALFDIQAGSPPVKVSTLDFGPLGQTTRPEATVVWLAAGAGAARRYISIRVDPVTGLTEKGDFQATAPPYSEQPLILQFS